MRQSLECFDFYTRQIEACDAEIEHTYGNVRPGEDNADELPPLPAHKRQSHSKDTPQGVQIRQHLKRICGVDVTAMHGIGPTLAQELVMETGTDMHKFPNEKHFCSWLGLAPKNEISGGKVLRSATLKTRNRAGQAFRKAAASVMRSECVFGVFYRRLKARVYYRMLKDKREYQPLTVEVYEQKYREQQVKYLKKRAAKLGFQLAPS